MSNANLVTKEENRAKRQALCKDCGEPGVKGNPLSNGGLHVDWAECTQNLKKRIESQAATISSLTARCEAAERDAGRLQVKVCYLAGGHDPFITWINGQITVDCLKEIEAQFPDDLDEGVFDLGAGDYTYIVRREEGQYDELGRCEFQPYWSYEFVTFVPIDAAMSKGKL